MKQSGEQTQIYSASFYYMEANTATMLRELDIAYDVADAEIEQRIHNIEKQTGMQLDEHQVQAVKEAVRNGLLVITGVRVQVRQLRSIRSSDILRWKAWTFFWQRNRTCRKKNE